jgi:hypothetical protein
MRWVTIACCLLGQLTVSGCGSAIRDTVHSSSCGDGTVKPLADVPEAERGETIAPALAAIDDLWAGPMSVSLRCPERPALRITLTVAAPEVTDFVAYGPPADGGDGTLYRCPDAAAGPGRLSVDGLIVDGAAITVATVPFFVVIKNDPSSTLVEGRAQLDLTGTDWKLGTIDYGIDRDARPYGMIGFSRPVKNGGEGMACEMTDITPGDLGSLD